MKLKEFNVDNTISARGSNLSKKPGVALNTKSGLFTFSHVAVSLMGIKPGDQIVCHQDEDEQDAWYWEKVSGNGFVLRAKLSVTKGLLFNNTVLARAIASSVGMEGNSGRAILSPEPVKIGKRILWTIITAGLKKKYTYPE